VGKNRGLGRGLAALVAEFPAGQVSMMELELSQVRPNPRQPRKAHVVEPAHPDPDLMDARVVTEQSDATLPRAVIFRDSFASALIPFLSEHFSRTVYLWQNNFDPDIVTQEHPDVVIQEWVGRHLGTDYPYNAVADVKRASATPSNATTRTAQALR